MLISRVSIVYAATKPNGPKQSYGAPNMMLTDLEAVFRCFKSDLGLRPIFHHKEDRADSHLFITVLAYQLVQLIRRRIQESGIDVNGSWRTLREIMSTQCRVTASFRRSDGKALHVRKATRAEPEQIAIYRALKANPVPEGISKSIFQNFW